MWSNESPLNQYLTELGLLHADDMSGIIINCLWSEVHGEPWVIDEEIEKYREYWKELAANQVPLEL